MKKALILVFITLMFSLAFFCSAYAQGLKYESESGHYSFLFPEGWEEIPKTVIEENRKFAKEEYGIEVPEYKAGFYLEGNDYFEFPYILIEEKNRGGTTFEEVVSSLKKEGYILKLTEKMENDLSEFVSGISFGEALVDKENYKVFMAMEGDNPSGEMNALGGLYFGRDIVVHLFCYSSAGYYNEDLVGFKTIADSFNFEEKYQYNYKPEKTEQFQENNQDTQSNFTNDYIRNFLVYGGVGAVITAIAVIINKKIKK